MYISRYTTRNKWQQQPNGFSTACESWIEKLGGELCVMVLVGRKFIQFYILFEMNDIVGAKESCDFAVWQSGWRPNRNRLDDVDVAFAYVTLLSKQFAFIACIFRSTESEMNKIMKQNKEH